MRKAFRFEGDMLSSSIIKAALAWVRHGGKIVALHGIGDDGQARKPRTPWQWVKGSAAEKEARRALQPKQPA